MTTRKTLAALLALFMLTTTPGLAPAQSPGPPPGATGPAGESEDLTPPRVSYLHGEVSFWRPGADDWGPATLNTPLAPGDTLFASRGGNVEIQVGPRAFVRAGDGTQIGLDDQDPDYTQLRVTEGHVAIDVRELPDGEAIEIGTPSGAFVIERPGFYRLDVTQDAAAFRAQRGGSATLIPAGGSEVQVGNNRQVVLRGIESVRVEAGPAPELTAWDRWNYERTDALLSVVASSRYVPAGVYGAETLAQHGSWRSVETYGNVWVPARVAPGWQPYSTGRWIWDPRYGWTWLDDAPWGWAPYHYGRWVFVGSYWAWAPGPVVVRPVYAPALVVFLGGGVSIGVGARPLGWAPLGWGEPVIPWWGRPHFVGRPYWGGWGGPRVVNNVVINRNTTVNVTNINVYKNVHVTNAVMGVPADRFGHGRERPARIAQNEARQLAPVHGALPVKPVAASLAPRTGRAAKPSEQVRERPVVVTRAPRDVTPALRSEGLVDRAPTPAARVVPSSRSAERGGDRRERQAAPPGPSATPGTEATRGPDGKDDRRNGRGERDADRRDRQTAPAGPGQDGAQRATPPAAPGAPRAVPPQGTPPEGPRPDVTRPEPGRPGERQNDAREQERQNERAQREAERAQRESERRGRQTPPPPPGQDGAQRATPPTPGAPPAAPRAAPPAPTEAPRPEPPRPTERQGDPREQERQNERAQREAERAQRDAQRDAERAQRSRQTAPPTPGQDAAPRATTPAPPAPRAVPAPSPAPVPAPQMERRPEPPRPEPRMREERPDRDAERRSRQQPQPAPTPAPPPPQPQVAPRPAPAPPPQPSAAPRPVPQARPEPPRQQPPPQQAPPPQPAPAERRPERPERPDRSERPDRQERGGGRG